MTEAHAKGFEPEFDGATTWIGSCSCGRSAKAEGPAQVEQALDAAHQVVVPGPNAVLRPPTPGPRRDAPPQFHQDRNPFAQTPVSTERVCGAATGEQNVPATLAQFDAWLAEHDAKIRAAERASIISDLRWLAEARGDYAGNRRDYCDVDLIECETNAARLVTNAIEGEEPWGWLPSWRWGEWKRRQDSRKDVVTDTTPICQVQDVNTDLLTCTEREPGGYRCEVVGPHERHKVGQHTIRHSRAGNGYWCSAIDNTIEPLEADPNDPWANP